MAFKPGKTYTSVSDMLHDTCEDELFLALWDAHQECKRLRSEIDSLYRRIHKLSANGGGAWQAYIVGDREWASCLTNGEWEVLICGDDDDTNERAIQLAGWLNELDERRLSVEGKS